MTKKEIENKLDKMKDATEKIDSDIKEIREEIKSKKASTWGDPIVELH